MVDLKFNELEKETLVLIEKHNMEVGLHSEEKLSNLYGMLSERIDGLRHVDAQLKTDKYLSGMIGYFNEGNQNAEKIIGEAAQEIEVRVMLM